MKNKIFSFLLVFIVATIVSVPVRVMAQDCSGYYMLHNNAEYELANYDKKDKLTGRVQYKVTSVNSSPAKTEATLHSKVFDEKGELATESDYIVTCQNGGILIDIRSMMDPEMFAAYQNMDVKMHGDHLNYPLMLTTGQKLDDGTFTIDVLDKQSGQALTSIVMNITERTVGDKESIHVPAGAYSAFKINQDMEMQTRAVGINMPATRLQTVEYFVPGVGMVRSEAYKNGKLQSYTVLNKIVK
jgi:hypothetical protein